MIEFIPEKDGFRLFKDKQAGGWIDKNSLCEENSWIDCLSTAKNTNIYGISLIQNSLIENSYVLDSTISNVCIKYYSIMDSNIDKWQDLFTWFDKDHIIFQYSKNNFHLKYDMIRLKRDLRIWPGTYIAEYSGRKSMHVVWNVNEKKSVNHTFITYFLE